MERHPIFLNDNTYFCITLTAFVFSYNCPTSLLNLTEKTQNYFFQYLQYKFQI